MTRESGKFQAREEGQGLTEYAMMLALALILLMGMVQMLGGRAKSVLSDIASHMQQHVDSD